MKRKLVLIVCLSPLGFLGCQAARPAREGGAFAPVLKQPDVGLQIPAWSPLVDGKEPDPASPKVLVEMQWISAEPGLLKELGLAPGKSVLPVATAGQQAALLKLLEAGRAQVLAAPNLVVYSGQQSHVLIAQQYAYIQDLEAAASPGGAGVPALKPVIGVLNTGTVFGLKAKVEEGAIELSSLQPQSVQLLGTRTCRAKIPAFSPEPEFFWEEPVFLVATLDPEVPPSIRLCAGETALVKLRYQVKQACANARAFAEGGEVKEAYQPRLPLAEGQSSPLDRECVAAITARIAE